MQIVCPCEAEYDLNINPNSRAVIVCDVCGDRLDIDPSNNETIEVTSLDSIPLKTKLFNFFFW